MKLYYSTKNIHKNSSDMTKKNSEIDKYSPIKVRRKNSMLIKVNSLESYKNFKKSNNKEKSFSKHKSIITNYNIFILNNLLKYNSYPHYYYIKIANQLLFNFSNHLVSNFKDNLIWNEKYDYFKNFYNLKKSNELLPKIGKYYEIYTLFVPNSYPLRDINNIISKYIKNRMKYLEITENNEDCKDEIKDIDKNIIENNTDGNDKKIDADNKSKKEINNNKKIINSTEIKTENSCSVSNYFGKDSIIKCRENSNFGDNNNFENQLVNYSLLNKIKKNLKEKKNDDKTNLDFSFELACIIQSFEENEKNYYKNLLTPKAKSLSSKKLKPLKDSIKPLGINNYNTYNNYYKNNKYRSNQKFKKNINKFLKKKNQINNKIYKKKENNKVVQISIKTNTINNNSKQNVYSLYKKNILKNKSKDFYSVHYLTFNTDENNYNLKFNDNNINVKNNFKNIYNSYISNKSYKNKICRLLHKKILKPLSTIEKNKIILESNSQTLNKINNSRQVIYKNKEKKSKSISKDNKNIFKRKIKTKNNLILNVINKIKYNKANENIQTNTSPSLNKKRNRNISRNANNNDNRSLSQRYHIKNFFSDFNPKKIIFVKTKKLNNSQKFRKQKFETNSSYKESSTLNSNKTSNKIIVNKNEKLIKSIKTEKKVKHSKNITNLKIINNNNFGVKNSLKNSKSFVETEYNTFIPKMIIKKRFLNGLNNEKKLNKKSNKYEQKKNYSISKNQNTCSSSINSKATKNVTNYIKLSGIKIQNTCSKNKVIYKNKRLLTEFNKLINFAPKKRIKLRTKSGNRSKEKHFSKISIFSLKDSPFIKYNNISFKNNNNKNIFNKTINEISKIKIKNFKESFVKKNNYLLNVNLFNNFKISPENYNNKKQIKITNLNNSLKPSLIKKNHIYNLIKNSPIKNKNNSHKKLFKLVNQEFNSIKNNTNYSIDSTGLSKRNIIINYKLNNV